jgi:hypothetical protein
MHNFNRGDLVEVINSAGTEQFQDGCWLTVERVSPDYVYLKGIDGGFRPDRFEVMQEDGIGNYKAGDRVRILSDFYGRGFEQKMGTVTRTILGDTWPIFVKVDGEDSEPFYTKDELEMIVEKPNKAKSQKITLEEVQVGDLIVCFWKRYGVETRKKGTVGRIDSDGCAIAVEGNALTHNVFGSWANERTPAEHIYLLSRPEPQPEPEQEPLADWEKELLGIPFTPKKPEIENGTYWVAQAGIPLWRVVVKDEETTWFCMADNEEADSDYAWLLRVKNGTAYGQTLLTEDPTPAKELTNLEKFKRAGYVGAKFKDGNLHYKISAKGNVKAKWMDVKGDTWDTESWEFEVFQSLIEQGKLVKIS